MLSPHFQRAQLLMQQARYDLAEQELGQELSLHPDNAHARALLALCLINQKKEKRALEEAQQSIHLGPDFSFTHYTLAMVLHRLGRQKDAQPAAAEALRLDPDSADNYSLLGFIQFNRRDWTAALASAEQGLRIDPHHTDCSNLRASALIHLGRRAEAGATLDASLARHPENAATHANQGWALLHANQPRQAMHHFREALRLRPDLEWARLGIVEALKAHNPLYRLMLAYFLWMSRRTRKWQWAIIIGGLIAYNAVRQLAASQPALAPFLWPLIIAYFIFVLLTWISDPLFNLTLRLSRFGRLALSRDQTVASNWFALILLLAAAALILWPLGYVSSPLAAILILPIAIPATTVYRQSNPRHRRILAIATLLLAALGSTLICIFLPMPFPILPMTLYQTEPLVTAAVLIYIWGSLLSPALTRLIR